MNRSEHQWLSRLETNHSELAALTRSVQSAGQATAAGSPEAPPMSNYEMATSMIDRVSTEAMLRLLAENREQVERAFERLQVGLYGYCEDCGRRIPEERLRFRPEATRCVECQSRLEDLQRIT
jgi:phage/conjugal plasmid C-4 type zinc finger TraR family protein